MLEQKLSNFVSAVYSESKRDVSHGHSHCLRVAKRSMDILVLVPKKEIQQANTSLFELIKLVLVVAWLHDACDHKNNFSNLLLDRMKLFLSELKCPVQLVLNIISRISYSKENKSRLKGEELDWLKVLGKKGLIVRNVVSDADKIDALGKIGLKRCIQYTRHCYPKINNDELIQKVRSHAKKKLLHLKDNFIRTVGGKIIAEKLHEELRTELNKL